MVRDMWESWMLRFVELFNVTEIDYALLNAVLPEVALFTLLKF